MLSSDLLFFVVQSLSHVHLFVTPWSAACQASLSFTISWSLFKFMSIMFHNDKSFKLQILKINCFHFIIFVGRIITKFLFLLISSLK